MVIECVQLQITAGRESEFESAMIQSRALFLAAAGCHGCELARGVEQPSSYLLQIEWDSIDAHMDFTKTSGIVTFRNLVGPYFAAKPAMAHYNPIGL